LFGLFLFISLIMESMISIRILLAMPKVVRQPQEVVKMRYHTFVCGSYLFTQKQ
jgi:hypothetical protein